MYPLTVIRIARGHEVRIELKSGNVYTGILHKCDLWMNIHMKNAIKDNSEEVEECYVKGSAIKTVQCMKKHLSMQEILQNRRR
ncbi:U6 snRNA-associated Sm-like protein LSm4 [Nematocida major]|uniref:U6 snRNA-associated Sm-like protein LSm4 n=1 Tax=Nematocida major TaxID=1912982 RepID=UPI0020084729|nr:U6 snRNA-associated Sm-like protein LSm4 [Nematocida major]KAH9385604.1 U6 snRNA-associated Sm-like protein LSm4 [Nematocida major]